MNIFKYGLKIEFCHSVHNSHADSFLKSVRGWVTYQLGIYAHYSDIWQRHQSLKSQ